MRISDLRDWHSCLKSLRQRLDYSNFKAAAGETEGEVMEGVLVFSQEIDEDIAEGMLHSVVSLPLQEVSPQLELFAAELQKLQCDPIAITANDFIADAYKECYNEIEYVQRGLSAIIETFRAYTEGRYDLRRESLETLKQVQKNLKNEPQKALSLVGEAACLVLRGMEEDDSLWYFEEIHSPKEPLSDWLVAVASIVDQIVENLEEYPLGEVELARDQWRNPNDKERNEYKRGKMIRLGIVDIEVQSLFLPLFSPQEQSLSEAERKAILGADSRVVSGLIAIAADEDSQMESSISGGEAAIRAVELLGEMRAAEAVPTLINILQNTEWNTIIHDRALQVLQDQMPDLAFDMALDIFDHTKNIELKSEMAGILAHGGKEKPGVFERLIEFLRREKSEQDIVAGYLADLGDPRALPDLHKAFRKANHWVEIVEIEDAILRLGGELTAAEAEKSYQIRAQMRQAPSSTELLPPVPATKSAAVHVTKIGRNEQCPCGSGKKYKKCCGR